jgi:hypothetical protein
MRGRRALSISVSGDEDASETHTRKHWFSLGTMPVAVVALFYVLSVPLCSAPRRVCRVVGGNLAEPCAVLCGVGPRTGLLQPIFVDLLNYKHALGPRRCLLPMLGR